MNEYRKRIITKFGDHDVFSWERCQFSEIKTDEVFIQIHYSGVNFADVIARKGFYQWAGKPPLCVGFEYSGKVIECGKNTPFKKGDYVFGISAFHAYAEAILTHQRNVWKLPKGMSLEEAAALPAVYLTAYHCLTEIMRVRKDDDILIHAVAGGVGLAALQIGKSLGLKTLGTASSDKKLRFAKKHGLDHLINYTEKDFEKEVLRLTQGIGVKFILDSLGGNMLQKSFRSLKPTGHIVSIGGAEVVPLRSLKPKSIWQNLKKAKQYLFHSNFNSFHLITHNKGISGVQILLLSDMASKLTEDISTLIKMFQKKQIKPHIDKIFSLENAYEAHQYMESRRSMGKILLKTRFQKK